MSPSYTHLSTVCPAKINVETHLQVNRGRGEVRHCSRIRPRRRRHLVLPAQAQRGRLSLHLTNIRKRKGRRVGSWHRGFYQEILIHRNRI